MVISVKPVQLEKANPPILVTLLGMVISVKPVQPEKAYHPIVVTPSGIVTDVKPEQPEKAPSQITVTPLGMVYPVTPQLGAKAINKVSFTIRQRPLSDANFPSNFFKLVQPEKAQLPIEVTFSGIVIEVKPVQ